MLARPAPDGHAWLSPSLFRLHPAEVVTVDRAGYAHVEKGDLPSGLLAMAEGEPEAVLRAEVLRAAAVRRPEVRSMLAWLDERSFEAVVVLRDGPDAIAALALPRGDRRGPMPLSEVLALRALADRLAAIASVSAALARSRARELSSRERAEAEGAEAERLAGVLDHQAGRLRAIAEMLARPARVAAYSPAARVAIETLERLGEAGRPVTLLLAPGLDPIPWAAVAHLASPRRDGALVIVEGVGSRDLHDVATWRDLAVSPLTAARGGTLVLLDAHALPLDVQRYVAVAAGADVGLIVALHTTVDALVGQGRVDEHLADRLGDRAVALPPLAARAEDLRGLLLDRLARIGERLRGRPMGLAPQGPRRPHGARVAGQRRRDGGRAGARGARGGERHHRPRGAAGRRLRSGGRDRGARRGRGASARGAASAARGAGDSVRPPPRGASGSRGAGDSARPPPKGVTGDRGAADSARPPPKGARSRKAGGG